MDLQRRCLFRHVVWKPCTTPVNIRYDIGIGLCAWSRQRRRRRVWLLRSKPVEETMLLLLLLQLWLTIFHPDSLSKCVCVCVGVCFYCSCICYCILFHLLIISNPYSPCCCFGTLVRRCCNVMNFCYLLVSYEWNVYVYVCVCVCFTDATSATAATTDDCFSSFTIYSLLFYLLITIHLYMKSVISISWCYYD